LSRESQPINRVQWVPRDRLHANDYNPNHVAKPELKLLATSILEDGWTQPIVAYPDGTIVDGFHRWTVAGWKEVAALTGGAVPVVFLDRARSHRMLSTIRHNRARGVHGVVPMAKIVQSLKDTHGMSDEEIEQRLGMEPEEIDRLYDRAPQPEKISREKPAFSKAWVPTRDAA
jgi:ParB-like chromosome segregation protein Spo0J